MNRDRFVALSIILFGVAAFGISVWLMYGWSAGYDAGLAYTSVILEASRTGTTLYPLQESPPFGGGLLGIWAPVILAAVGAGFFISGIRDLNRAP